MVAQRYGANIKDKLQLSSHLERPINDNCKSEITQYSYHNNREHIDINHLPAILNKHIILVSYCILQMCELTTLLQSVSTVKLLKRMNFVQVTK